MDIDPLVIRLALIGLLLLLSGFFSGTETALFSLGRTRLRRLEEESETEEDLLSRDRVSSLLSRPRRLLISILIGNELVNISISILSAAAFQVILCPEKGPGQAGGCPERWLFVTLISTAIVTPLLLIFGEITPKTLAVRRSEAFARTVALPIELFARAVFPVRWLIKTLFGRIVDLAVGEEPQGAEGRGVITEEDLRTLVDMGEKDGILDPSERELIQNVFEFGDRIASNVMTPRADVFSLPENMPFSEVLQNITEEHFSRIPIYEGDKDNIIGILYANDLIPYKKPGVSPPEELARLARTPYFVPETKKADELFREFRSKKIHMAIVVDEFGGIAGLVTMEDLLEELFGEIIDEDEVGETLYDTLEDGSFLVSARLPIERFNEITEAQFQDESSDTIGGLVFNRFGKLPVQGESIEIEGYRFQVRSITGTKIEQIEVRRLGLEPAPELLSEIKADRGGERGIDEKDQGRSDAETDPSGRDD